ncbi:hypothetical protein [Streptomyces sp. NPDC003077]|uniref:hypothetical protein n=1 Tax=Streptomyces sp. NPDC003077 TaxID=3154443 RepID=UPI0033B7E8FF
MGKRVESADAVGCLVAAVGASVGLGVWLRGALPGIRGGFEGERDLSLLYVELPLMLVGVPALTLASWALTGVALRRRVGRGARAAVSGGAAVVALAALAWACLAWLDVKVDAVLQDGG